LGRFCDPEGGLDAAAAHGYADNGLAKKITPPTGSPTEMHYDARMQRFVVDWAGTLTYFLWDGMNQLVEKDSSLVTTREHTHGATPIEGIGSIVVTKRKTNGSHQYQTPHYDHRGSLFVLQGGATGDDVDTRAEYNAFGEEIAYTSMSTPRFGYQGTAWMRLALPDGSAWGLSTIRIQNPRTGRFKQMDFRWQRSSPHWNLYVYANSSPLHYVDPKGAADVLTTATLPIKSKWPEYVVTRSHHAQSKDQLVGKPCDYWSWKEFYEWILHDKPDWKKQIFLALHVGMYNKADWTDADLKSDAPQDKPPGDWKGWVYDKLPGWGQRAVDAGKGTALIYGGYAGNFDILGRTYLRTVWYKYEFYCSYWTRCIGVSKEEERVVYYWTKSKLEYGGTVNPFVGLVDPTTTRINFSEVHRALDAFAGTVDKFLDPYTK
jgi:RHS repeat-associated protein